MSERFDPSPKRDHARARTIPVALSIAGSDSSGGAGIQADLKTFSALGVYGTIVLTAITAQNTLGVRAIHNVPSQIVTSQLDAVFEDVDIRAAKIGMLSDTAIVEAVADGLSLHHPRFVVLDPVMVATSGSQLIAADAIDALKFRLMPLADCLTPNLAEAAALLGTEQATSETEMAEQGHALLAFGPGAVLMKGGHSILSEAVDLLISNRGTRRYSAKRISSRNLHGTGCTLSAAIAAGLALGQSLGDAVDRAKTYVTAAIAGGQSLKIGHGCGPVHYFRGFEAPTH